MNLAQIKEQLIKKDDHELIRSTTIDKDLYTRTYLEHAQSELQKRGIDPATYLNRLRVSLNDKTSKTVSVKEALRGFAYPLSRTDGLFFSNMVDETLIFQKENKFWAVHYFYEEEYSGSFTIGEKEKIPHLLQAFAQVKDWQQYLADEYRLDDWSFFAKSQSENGVKDLTMALENAGIPYTMRSLEMARFNAIFGTYHDEWPIHIFVPADYLDDAFEILDTFNQKIDDLYRQANQYAGSGQTAEELAVYEQLATLAPHDKLIFFNSGCIYFDQEKYPEAAASFLEAVNADDPKIVREAEGYLKEIITKIPPTAKVLHTLASLSYSRYDDQMFYGKDGAGYEDTPGRSLEMEAYQEALGYYQLILQMDVNDAIAHLNLGYLYYHDESANAEALKHFQKYLELNPEAEDRETINSVIKSLLEV